MSIQRHEASGHLSKAVEHNGVVYVAGLTATNKSLGMKQQTEEVLKKIDGYLEACGTNKSKLLASTVYGALLLLTSDVIARTMLPVELPVGIITAILGAPYLIWLLLRRNRKVSA